MQSGLALAMALLINKKFRGVNFFRTVYFLPVVTSMVVVSLLWLFMYRKDGLINEMLSTLSFGLIHGADWLNDPATAMPAIIALSIWQAAGFHMIIWLAGLQSISGELYEAAQLDGASRWHQFRYVTWPGLKHTRSLVLVTITIQALGLFDQVSVMTQGGPARLHHHHHLRGGPLRLQTAGNLLRLGHLAGILRPRAAHLRGAALPDPREGLT